jgi:DNA-binding transcriptional MerR regulator
VRIGELGRSSGIAVPTIKYYLREGLLHRGDATAPNQANYDATHVRRLRLIRVLTEIGRLSLGAVKEVLRAIADDRLPVHQMIGVAQYALGPPPDAAEPADDVRLAREEVDTFLRRLRWRVSPDAPGRRALADALVALRGHEHDVGAEVFDHYADVASELASYELDRTDVSGRRSAAVENVIVGTVVYEAAFNALRRLAHEDHSARRRRTT